MRRVLAVLALLALTGCSGLYPLTCSPTYWTDCGRRPAPPPEPQPAEVAP